MIVRMKELIIFTLSSKVDDTVQLLGKLGVVDIQDIRTSDSEQVGVHEEHLKNAERAIAIINSYDGKEKEQPVHSEPLYDPKELVERVLEAEKKLQDSEKQIIEQQQALQFYSTWGEKFNIHDLDYLRSKGLYLRLYMIDQELPSSVTGSHDVIYLDEKKGKTPIILVGRSEDEKLNLKEVYPPVLGIGEVRVNLEKAARINRETKQFIRTRSKRLPDLEVYREYLKDRLKMQQAAEGMGDVGGCIKYLKGYIPVDAVGSFKQLAEKEDWGYVINEPENSEAVPVYIKNPKWVSIIDPVMKFIDIVPGYKEVDVSIYFLIAFALFFAMLVGDAGYGVIFLILAMLMRKKLPKAALFLVYVLSGATIVWGVISGTYFGSETIAALPVLNSLVIDNVASFGVDNINFMMHFSFLIGALHITIAHGIKLVQFINSLKALSEVGWIALVWALFFITEQLVLGIPMPYWSTWLMIGGALLVALFSFESKSFVKSMLLSIANLPLSLISGFSDIVSYVRLFAVGMATAAVASSFNNMIVPNGFGYLNILEILVASIALLLGHGLNIALALMAVMVHGIRLNMLEFAGHLGLQFSGEAYRPFKLKTLEYPNNHKSTNK